MTKNHNVSRLSGRWRNITKECKTCKFNLNKENKICNYRGLTIHIYSKSFIVYKKCQAKDMQINN